MTTKMVRLSITAEETAKKYGRTVSDGIIRMDEEIKSTVSYSVFNESYWKRMESIVKGNTNTNRVVTLPEKFRPASVVKKEGFGDEPRDANGNFI